MIRVVDNLQDPLIPLLENDPVRPHIPAQLRVGKNSRVLVLFDQDQPQSVVCVSFSDHVVTEEDNLFTYQGDAPTVAILYTIWSISKGGGAAMVPAARAWIQQNHPQVTRLVTLSPLTEMARRFHLKNGACELQMNTHTVNFEYALD